MTIKDKFLVILVVAIWGFNFVVIRWGIEDLHPLSMTILRFFLTAFPAILFVKKPDISIRYVGLYGILFGTGVWGLVNFAVFYGMPAGIASLLLQLSPFLTIIAALVFFKEKLSKVKYFGIFLAFIGFITVCLSKSENLNLLNISLMFLAALFWTICNVIIKYTKPKNVVSFTVWSSAFVPLPIIILSFIYMFSFDFDENLLFNFPS